MTRLDAYHAACALDDARRAHEAELRDALHVEVCSGCGGDGRDADGVTCTWCYGTAALPVECAHPCEPTPPPRDEDDPHADTLGWMPDAWREEHTRRVVDTAFCGKERAA